MSYRHRLVLGLGALAITVLAALVGVTVLSLALGWRLLAAGSALATLAASPLVLLGPAQDWWRFRRGRKRRHRQRPEDFGR
jgi:hypothetical protein